MLAGPALVCGYTLDGVSIVDDIAMLEEVVGGVVERGVVLPKMPIYPLISLTRLTRTHFGACQRDSPVILRLFLVILGLFSVMLHLTVREAMETLETSSHGACLLHTCRVEG